MSNETGQNTAAGRQAIVRFDPPDGCVSEAFRDAIRTGLRIEFPDALAGDATVDVLTSAAVRQVVDSLLASPAFTSDLVSLLQNDQTILNAITTELIASTAFKEALTAEANTAVNSEDNLKSIATALLANTDFKTQMTSCILESDAASAAFNTAFQTAWQALNLVACGTNTFVVNADNEIEIPLTGLSDNADIWFDYRTNLPVGSAVDVSGHYLVSQNDTTAVVGFPNANPGDSIPIRYFRIRC